MRVRFRGILLTPRQIVMRLWRQTSRWIWPEKPQLCWTGHMHVSSQYITCVIKEPDNG